MSNLTRIIATFLFSATLTAGAAGCDKKKDDKPAPSAKGGGESGKEAPAAEPAKASQAECEKVVANQLALETDPSIKNSMNMVKDTMIEECTKSMSSKQAQCAAAAGSGGAFADCLLQK